MDSEQETVQLDRLLDSINAEEARDVSLDDSSLLMDRNILASWLLSSNFSNYCDCLSGIVYTKVNQRFGIAGDKTAHRVMQCAVDMVSQLT